jgi:2,3-bisphosphoglycerate-independent phosphoglycerate mutase
MARILLLFVDGIGLAPAGDANPLSTVAMPAVRALLGGPLTLEQVQRRDGLVLVPLDATLGVAGLPQSGTGQTALFTGENGAVLLGHHVPAFPGPTLRRLIAEHSIFKQVVQAGRRAVFANPLPESFVAAVENGERRGSVTTWAAIAAGRTVMRDLEDLRAGRAVAWDVSGDHFATRAGYNVGFTAPRDAGRNLATIAAGADLTVWETFLTDLAAHGRWGLRVDDALTRLDGLLDGLLAEGPDDLTVLLTSDHGNLEDSTHRVHTKNPVPLLAVGPSAGSFEGLRSLLEVTPTILETLAIARSN